MKTAAALVQAIREVGVRLLPEGDKIRLLPPGALPSNLREELVRAKPEVLALLRAEESPPNSMLDPSCTLGRDSTRRCPKHGYTHGALRDAQSNCSECGRPAPVALETSAGQRLCRRCFFDSTPDETRA